MRLVVMGMCALVAAGVFGAMFLAIWSTRHAPAAPTALRQSFATARVGRDPVPHDPRGRYSGGNCHRFGTHQRLKLPGGPASIAGLQTLRRALHDCGATAVRAVTAGRWMSLRTRSFPTSATVDY